MSREPSSQTPTCQRTVVRYPQRLQVFSLRLFGRNTEVPASRIRTWARAGSSLARDRQPAALALNFLDVARSEAGHRLDDAKVVTSQ